MPLQVSEAFVLPAQPPLSRETDQKLSRVILLLDCAEFNTVCASVRVKISPAVSFCPIMGVTPSIVHAIIAKMERGASVTLQLKRGENTFFSTLRISNGTE